MVLKTPADVCKLLNTSMKDRISSGTKMNETSSRSHAIVTARLLQMNKAADEVIESTFIFGDLAGSERQSKTDLDKGTLAGC